MKQLFLSIAACCVALSAIAQITITSADMPVKGDTLRFSTALPLGLNSLLNDTGANKTWNVDTLTPVTQRLIEYKSALHVNPVYGFTIAASAYGYMVADSLGGVSSQLPVSIKEVYTFFNKKGTAPNDRFIAEGFGAKIAGAPVPANYSNEDELYFFPLDYGDKDTSDYSLKINIPTVGSTVQTGDRYTSVDGWGTIKTPFFTTAQSCLRIRSEVNGVDSVQLGSFPAVGIPRQSIDYIWLVKGEHYPALWITANMVGSTPTITNVRYRDTYRVLSVDDTKAGSVAVDFKIYPNPATESLHIDVPVTQFSVSVFDMQGRNVINSENNKMLDISGLAAGNYIIRLITADGIGYQPFVKK